MRAPVRVSPLEDVDFDALQFNPRQQTTATNEQHERKKQVKMEANQKKLFFFFFCLATWTMQVFLWLLPLQYLDNSFWPLAACVCTCYVRRRRSKPLTVSNFRSFVLSLALCPLLLLLLVGARSSRKSF